MALRDIIRRFKAEFGRSSWSILMPAPCVTALNALVHYLDSSDVQDLFQELFTLLSESALRWNVTKGMTRVILGMIESKGDAVPPELRKSLQAIAAGQWKSQDHLQFSSSYPNYVMVRQKLEAPEMSDLLEQWAGLNFGDEPAEIGDSTEAGAAKALG
ncbi:uncharacterized protein HMPREF1541_10777 [Cyphellophora europaea CBS 101466]|uniref:Uncharacterized protein n=1 Tax=Cyphellophora europaea (strain CBS 101466) TaxID=1220924 RepID=W2S692_CYPE1|nr:uncharacterized protein HMPREF1541_10777 [Cyphellophora europaea CBS 101466]ETN44226.1 hypothetical protein HMPREF1541_10777 [Cyphellophora europaea CBS 101466]